ncbi:Splicing factor, arginine/serine-rich 15 [Oryzias melastigma]|uniref:Splicing factor, arginine/serine-rich 15 n=1 Tax=Oryzias melastigma TaxID=30732 RepID=A0A834C904_ORYME|nr:SR-related and CTD-associated factor 4 [Oryzias melastigma]KAF6724960.1 Splicing factor, arginine/serine-rich 15 [Oryzias melastigma]
MEAVNAFNMELFSMIDMKPPISRAKMMSVTKSAIKAIKLYKHVVQIVEKFIKKCKPELKVPGLYVVDSIVRQSRHQFGVEKDVFGPRFLKNFTDTFQNLFLCPEDDKNKILRVLNLWQKNGVFEMNILQPLMDMATSVASPSPTFGDPVAPQKEAETLVSNASVLPDEHQLPTSDALAAVAQLLQSPHCQELQRMLQNLQQADRSTVNTNNLPNAPPMPVSQLNQSNSRSANRSSLAEKLLDRFDYDDDPEDVQTSENNIQLQNISESLLRRFSDQRAGTDFQAVMGENAEIKHLGGGSHVERHMIPDGYPHQNENYPQTKESSVEKHRRDGRRRGHGRRSRSRTRSRSPRRRSRSSSRSERSRHRGSRSRERRWRSHSNSQDRNQSEKDRERRQKGLPSIKSQTLSVCSTTLWVGQLDKKTQQSDVTSLLEEFGQIESIHMIPPRGCAYIVMVHRQDAYTALKKLSRGSYKVNQKPVKIAWALNKGIKSAHKKFWDVERGVCYIPWSKVKVEELESYREGGMLDADTLNPEWNFGKDLNHQAAVNGIPDDGVNTLVQMPIIQQTEALGSPSAFPGPIMLSPTSLPAGGAPFMPAKFDPASLSAARLLVPLDARENAGDKDPSLDTGTCNQMGSPGSSVMTLTPPAMQGPPGPPMAPLQPPPGMPNPHVPPFLASPNMQHMPPQMMPDGPMFPPNRFRMRMPFPPRGPPFQSCPPVGPEADREGRFFRGVRPGFPCPPFQRGRW